MLIIFALTEETKKNPKTLKFKANDRVRINKYKNIFIKGHTKNWSREIFVIDSVLKIIRWTFKIKYFNQEKNNRKLL